MHSLICAKLKIHDITSLPPCKQDVSCRLGLMREKRRGEKPALAPKPTRGGSGMGQ